MSKFKGYSFFIIAAVFAYAAWALPAMIAANTREQATHDAPSINPNPCTDAAFGETCMPNQLPLMFTEYLACSSKADIQVLIQSEVVACMQAYLAVKLSFISGLGLENFRGMPREKRGEINLQAFKAYRKWRDEKPNLVITPSAMPSATQTSI